MFRVRSSLAQDFEQTLFCPQMGKAVPALTHRGFVTSGPPALYSATWGRVRLRGGAARAAKP